MLDEKTINEIRNKPLPNIALIDYEFNGSTRSFRIYAYDIEEAKSRLQAIKETGHVKGFLVKTIPVHLPLSTPEWIFRMIGNILTRIVSFFKG